MPFPWAVIQAVLLRSFRSQSLVERSHKTATTINACPWGHRAYIRDCDEMEVVWFQVSSDQAWYCRWQSPKHLDEAIAKDSLVHWCCRCVGSEICAGAFCCPCSSMLSSYKTVTQICCTRKNIYRGKTIFEPHEILVRWRKFWAKKSYLLSVPEWLKHWQTCKTSGLADTTVNRNHYVLISMKEYLWYTIYDIRFMNVTCCEIKNGL